MKRMTVLLALALCIVFGNYAHAAAPGKILIGVSIPTADHGWTGGVLWWAKRATDEFAKKHSNVEFILSASEFYEEQATDLEAMQKRGLNGLIILPHRPASLASTLNNVHKAGVFIVVVDRSIPKVPKDIYLSGDNYGFGKQSGVYMAETLGGKGLIAVMEGIPCEGNTQRVNGFRDAIKDHPGIKILDSQPVYWNPDKGYEMMEQYLQQFPQMNAIWSGDDDVLESVLKAYKQSGRTDVQLMLGGGGSKQIIKMILDDNPLVHATVTYPPKMVYEGIRMTVEHFIEGKKFDAEVVLASELITKENAKEAYYPDNPY